MPSDYDLPPGADQLALLADGQFSRLKNLISELDGKPYGDRVFTMRNGSLFLGNVGVQLRKVQGTEYCALFSPATDTGLVSPLADGAISWVIEPIGVDPFKWYVIDLKQPLLAEELASEIRKRLCEYCDEHEAV